MQTLDVTYTIKTATGATFAVSPTMRAIVVCMNEPDARRIIAQYNNAKFGEVHIKTSNSITHGEMLAIQLTSAAITRPSLIDRCASE